jgi:nitrogen fixation/metabolism regulation signal transduction histidine kinase
MKLRRKFLLFVILIHTIFIALSLVLLSYSRYLFAAAEALILISILVSLHLYRAFLRPLNLLTAGIESIKDQDFSSKFSLTGQIDLAERQNLFTPFYSTKKDGQGVGLTLVREILMNHGFSFNLEPGPDGGSEFWIRF